MKFLNVLGFFGESYELYEFRHKLKTNLPGFPKGVNVEEESEPSFTGAPMSEGVPIGGTASLIFDSKRQRGGIKILVTGSC